MTDEVVARWKSFARGGHLGKGQALGEVELWGTFGICGLSYFGPHYIARELAHWDRSVYSA